MAAAPDSILPQSYFDGVSTLWGACAFLGAAVVAAGLVFHAARSRPEPASYLWVFAKVIMISIATVFIREWLMRLNDVVMAFGSLLGVDPRAVDEKFITFITGKTAANPDASVWDVIWGTKSIGTAFCYALLWLFGWLAWGLQYIVKLIGGVLLTAGWALSPLFLSFFMLRPMADVARKYLLGLIALVCWPIGWAIAAIVTNAMLDATATASLLPVIVSGSLIAPALSVLLIGAWMIVSAVLAPYITTKVLLMGANPLSASAQAAGGVAQGAFVGGVGAATAAVTGGAAAPAVISAAAVGATMAGGESAARGGGFPQTTAAAVGGAAGLYRGGFVRRQTEAMEGTASAQKRRAAASERYASQYEDAVRQARESDFPDQPYHSDPNQAAIEIEAHVKS